VNLVLKIIEGVGPTLLVYRTFERKVTLVRTVNFAGIEKRNTGDGISLTLSNPIFLPTAYSPALICFGR
jgi:hypothetical protein